MLRLVRCCRFQAAGGKLQATKGVGRDDVEQLLENAFIATDKMSLHRSLSPKGLGSRFSEDGDHWPEEARITAPEVP